MESKTRKIIDIVWDTDEYTDDEIGMLPTEVDVPIEVEEDEIADYLSDEYGWLVSSFFLMDEVKE